VSPAPTDMGDLAVVAYEDGHSVATMERTYAAWTKGAKPEDVRPEGNVPPAASAEQCATVPACHSGPSGNRARDCKVQGQGSWAFRGKPGRAPRR
jgi:hypothetical protein